MPLEPLVCARTAARVSSVLNRDVKHFGKQHLFDGSEETCWNSDQNFAAEQSWGCDPHIPVPALLLDWELQRFQVEETVLDKLKITFGSSTDFFGRVVVYHLGVLGERL
ncbi:hypothetical protein DV515_00017640 [Chloebia gouldiae]|uniref:Nuclear receptor 2C2-associated protein n=1 Tax=Chloebia gouldiae TaxID=44316 RepID=A0A3L8Q9S3_CHLGU|nr:hypothetical protein DV515_00017640 [Chloebia gouldiae]